MTGVNKSEKKFRVILPPEYIAGGYFGLVDGGIYTIDPEYDDSDQYRTLERTNITVNPSRGTYVDKAWCTIITPVNLTLPDELFD